MLAVYYDPCTPQERKTGTNHPETRQQLILAALQSEFPDLPVFRTEAPIPVVESWLCLIHDENYVGFLEGAYRDADEKEDKDWFSESGGLVPYHIHPYPYTETLLERNPLYKQAGLFAKDTMSPIFADTYNRALCASSNTLRAAEALCCGTYRCVYALNSNPGHHASHDRYAGYCFFNHASVAAENLLRGGATRVAILDLDYHAHDGAQSLFYKRNDIFTVSLHMNPTYDYPNYSGFEDEVGEGDGTGYNLNLCLQPKCTWRDYTVALARALVAISQREVSHLIIAFGCDTVEGDPDPSNRGGMRLQVSDYYAMGRQIAAATEQIPILVTAEGGYALDKVGGIMCQFFQGLLTNGQC